MFRLWGRKARSVLGGGWLWLAGCLPGSAAGLQPELPGVEVVEQRVGSSITFSLRNPQLAELTVSLDFSLLNLSSSVGLPLEVIVPPKCTTQPLVVLRPVDPAHGWNYTWHTDYSWGSPRARHAADQLYHLPYAPGRSFPVVQGRDGALSHIGESRYAIDFGLPEGTPVCAARDGQVVLVRDGFDVGAPDPAYLKRANLVFVQHSDGTLATYVHLLKSAIRVKVGENVRAGQVLGLSGNSGYTRGPHLHFMVFRSKSSKIRESLPLRFVTQEGSGLELAEGQSYTALASPTAATEGTNGVRRQP